MKTIFAIASLSVLLVCGARDYSLSTTVITERDEHFMPTTFFRRLVVDAKEEKRPITPINLFQKQSEKKKPTRSRDDNIWNWDYWCQLQPQMGNCSRSREKFYYDTQLDQCQTFKYTGCNGNKNKFNTMVDCERHCKGAAFAELKKIDKSTVCSLQPNAGLCVALFNRYYYDVNSGDCKNFIYGGCGGNGNRFHTKYKCREKCIQGEKVEYE